MLNLKISDSEKHVSFYVKIVAGELWGVLNGEDFEISLLVDGEVVKRRGPYHISQWPKMASRDNDRTEKVAKAHISERLRMTQPMVRFAKAILAQRQARDDIYAIRDEFIDKAK